MPVVPITHQEVQQQSFDVPVPHFAMPVKEAYTGVADANVEGAAKINQLVQGLGDKVVQNNMWQEQARMYDDREKLANNITDLMTNSGAQDITDANGVTRKVPIGYLNQSGFDTQENGGSKGMQEKMMQMRDELVDKYQMPQLKRQAARMFDNIVATGYRQAAMHEAQQVKDATAKTFLTSSMNEVHNATMQSTPDDLMNSMEHIHESYMKYGAYKGMSPDEITAGISPLYAKAAQNSALNILQSPNGTLEAAQAQLETVRPLIQPDDFNKINETLESKNKVMLAAVDRNDKIQKINNQFGMISDLATPGATPPTPLDVENMVKSGKVNLSFATDYNAAMKAFDEQRAAPKVDKKGKLIPNGGEVPYSLGVKDDEENNAFASTMKSIMASSDKEGLTSVLQQAMKEAGSGKFSEDKMKITMFYALQRSNMLDDGMGIARTVNPELSKLDGGVQSLMDFQQKAGGMDHQLYSDFFDALGKNASPKDAAESAKTNAVLRADPSVSTWNNTPISIKKSALTSAVMFKPGVKVYPHARLREGGNAPSP